MVGHRRDPRRCHAPHRRDGFSLAEVVVALVIFSIGALGAAALAAQAARIATGALRQEAALLRATTLLDSLVAAGDAGVGRADERQVAYRWRVRADSAGRAIDVVAHLRGSSDSMVLSVRRPPLPALLRPSP